MRPKMVLKLHKTLSRKKWAFLIRDANKNDLKKVLKISKQFPNELIQKNEQYFKKVLRNCYSFSVIEHNGKIIGYATVFSREKLGQNKFHRWFKKRFEQFLYIEQIVIAKEYHGQDIGSALLNKIIKKKNNCTVCLDVNLTNIKAINFYKKHGLKQIGVLKLKNNNTYAMFIKKTKPKKPGQ